MDLSPEKRVSAEFFTDRSRRLDLDTPVAWKLCPRTQRVTLRRGGTYQRIRQPGHAPFRLWVNLDNQFALLGPVERVTFDDAINVLERSRRIAALVLRHGTYRNRTEAEVHPQSERSAEEEEKNTIGSYERRRGRWSTRSRHVPLCGDVKHIITHVDVDIDDLCVLSALLSEPYARFGR